MSRKRQRLESFSENVRRRKSRKSDDAPPPATLTLKEKIMVIGTPMSVLLAIMLLKGYSSLGNHREHIEKRIEKWRIEHHLSDDEVRFLRDVEFEFHGDGFAALFRGKPSDEELERHKAAVDALLKE